MEIAGTFFSMGYEDQYEKKTRKKIVCFKVRAQNSTKINHFLLIFVHEFYHENKRKEIMLYTVGKEIYSSTRINQQFFGNNFFLQTFNA